MRQVRIFVFAGQASDQIKGKWWGEAGIFIADVTVSFVVMRFSLHVAWRTGREGRERAVQCNNATCLAKILGQGSRFRLGR